MNVFRKQVRWHWRRLLATWYWFRYGIRVGGILGHGSIWPEFGDGKFVSVRRKGSFLDILDKRTGWVIRLVPFQPNHGIMVERIDLSGNLHGRTHMDHRAFMGLFAASEEKHADADA